MFSIIIALLIFDINLLFKSHGVIIMNDITKNYTFRKLFDNHSSIMMIIDPETGHILDANDAAAAYYGFSKGQLESMRIHEINILSESQIQVEMALAAKEKRNFFNFTHRLANNELRDVEVHSIPVVIEEQVVLFSIIYDVTDKIRQRFMFDQLLLASPYAVIILDKEQRVVNINHNFSKLFQYKLEDVQGRTVSSLVEPGDYKKQIDANLDLVYNGQIVKLEGARKRKDGQLVDVEIIGYPLIYHQTVVGVYVIYIDLTEKKINEEQVLIFKRILESNSEGVVITDVNGNIEWVNNAFIQITGYSFDEVAGKNPRLLKSGLHSSSYYERMWD